MPIARFEMPDGRIARFEVPDGTTPEQAHAMIAEHLIRTNPIDAPAPQQPAYNPTDDMSTSDKFLAGAGMGAVNTARGAGQLLRDVLTNNVSDKLGLPTAQDVTEARQRDKALSGTSAGSWGDLAGSVASTAFFPGGTLAKTLASGAAMGALQPRAEGESLANNVGLGMAGGALGHGALAAGGRLMRPVRSELSPELSALAQKAQDAGIDLNAAQLTGSTPLKWLDSVMNDLPLTAAKQQAKNELQHTQFNSAIAKTMGTQADNLGEDVMAETRRRVGGAIGDIAARNKLNFDNQLLNDVTKHSFDAQRLQTGSNQKILNNYIDDFLTKVEPNGTVSGEAYRRFDSALGKRVRGTTDGDLRETLTGLRETLRGAMDRSISPDDATEWQTMRRQYANMKKVEPLAAKSVDGNISPSLLMSAAIKGDQNAAYRSSDLKELGQIGKTFLKPPPNSGTAQRQFYQKMLTSPVNVGNMLGSGAGFMAGGAPGAVLGGLLSTGMTSGAAAVPLQAMMNSKAGKKYLTKGMLESLQRYEQPIMRNLSAPVGAQGMLINMRE
jgi:hypothetical protein